MSDTRAWVKLRGIFKATITRIEKFIEDNDQIIELRRVQFRYEQLLEVWNKYDEVQMKLELHDDEDSNHNQDRIEMEEKFIELRVKFEQLLKPKQEGKLESKCSSQCMSYSPGEINLKLPTLRLPNFDGKYENWMSFSDVFKAMVHNNQHLVKIQKYQYLLSAVTGQALELIQNLPLTEINYDLAWKLLEDRYQNKRLIAATHVRELLGIKAVHKENASELMQFINSASNNLNALRALQIETPLYEVILLHLFTQRIDASSRKEWELTLTDQSFPALNTFFSFLEHKRQALESIRAFSYTMPKEINDKFKQDKVMRYSNSYLMTETVPCVCCDELHPLHRCQTFRAIDLNEKQQYVRKHKLCFNCLRKDHIAALCKSGVCKVCKGRHHTMLHRVEEPEHTPHQESLSHNNEQEQNTYCALKSRGLAQVLLPTAIVRLRDSCGTWHSCRALIDSGSQSNICTERIVQRLKLRKHKIDIPVKGINNIITDVRHSVEIQFKSVVGNFEANISCLVLPRITGCIPNKRILYKDWNLPSDVMLADPTFHQPSEVDLLIGAELFFQLMLPGQRTREGSYPLLQETKLGWVLAGRFSESTDSVLSSPRTSCFLRCDDSLDHQLQLFWQMEEFNSIPRTNEEVECEAHFVKNTSRDDNGRFVVRLPIKPEHEPLGNSLNQARVRLQKLEVRLSRQPALRLEYNTFLKEYEQLGHMKRLDADDTFTSSQSYYLPHHAVVRSASSTTKTRVVFDASASTTSNVSLNDILMVGATIQQDLYSIILRFRTHEVAFTADIEKMFRQVKVHVDDSKLQRILWRESPEEAVGFYELKTLTYGTASAPFLATRCLQQLAEDEVSKFPLASEILRRDFYVDDVLSGCHKVEEALQLQADLIELLHKGGFPLRKWCSNHPALLQAVPPEFRETKLPLQLDGTENVKTLGLLWHPTSDKFEISSSSTWTSVKTKVSKRDVASMVASIFDPLGLISPIVISHKMFLQQMWLHKVGWDDELPPDLLCNWNRLCQQLPLIGNIHVDRLVMCRGDPVSVQVHGFSDASERAYGACLYIRTENGIGETSVHLLCSKSRVAPVKRVTLPRLELCGAGLLAQLIQKTLPILCLNIDTVHLWTDSTVVLGWLASPARRWKTFVANKVSQIQEITRAKDWKHVSSKDNPADLISRGLDAETLRNLDLWWHGPNWLCLPESSWPSSSPPLELQDHLEERKPVIMVTTVLISDEIMSRYSTLPRLTRIVAYCRRFCSNTRSPNQRELGCLSAKELRESLIACIKVVQSYVYHTERQDLLARRTLSKKSELLSLHPFIDEQELLRVGGRLDHSELAYENKHQLILPPQHHLTKLIVAEEHVRLLHAGTQLMTASLRQQYWIPRIKQIIKHVTGKCLPCFKLKASATAQLMGQLPKARVEPSRPFSRTGVDYAGPFSIKTGTVRSKTTLKCYTAVFICLSTKAVHLELVSDLSAESFIAALRRFVARRGRCSHIFSDNGTNFVGANRELRDLRKLFLDQEFTQKLEDHAAKEGFDWHFIPPSSPHFGGLWEAAVKSLKHHLRRVVGKAMLTFEEFNTLLNQIEACLNSRPLTVLSSDPDDPTFLSPGHFLIGGPLLSLPEPDLTSKRLNYLSRWQRIQQMQQQLWKRWSMDYLNGLQQRRKWRSVQANLQPGMVVLVREDNLPPLSWKLAVIHETFPGSDGLTRVASIRVGTSIVKRPINKLIVLPNEDEN